MTRAPGPGRDVVVAFHGVCFAIGGKRLVGPLDFEIATGEVLVCLGRSGSGKTTTLRLVNRLVEPTVGSVEVEGADTLSWDPIALRRGIGYVIQEVGLFPHFTVAQNVEIVPRLEGWPKARREARVPELLELVGLPAEEFLRRYPHQLSGGQRQRVGVARALAADPPILLCDEPFGAVDPITRADLQREFKSLAQRLGKTVMFVTHDVREALVVGTRIALFQDGLVSFLGTVDEFQVSTHAEVRAFRESA